MSLAEVGWRIEDRLRQEVWAHRRFGPATLPPPSATTTAVGPGPPRPWPNRHVPAIPAATDLAELPQGSSQALLSAAEELLQGRAEFLGVLRQDMVDPKWPFDPVSGRAYPRDRCAFRIDYRSPADPRNVKQVWELSRHHHLTVLACAWQLTRDDRYAEMVARHLRSWWAENPVLCGVNWSSGIELGIRLISWVWTRRLLDGWVGAPSLFEDNETAVDQIYWHQRFLAAFRSRGSSANNHVIAEAAGQLVASCGFPWFDESARWRATATRLLESELLQNTFPCGLDREQAFGYHGFVTELGLVAAVEAEAAGAPVQPTTWNLLCRMIDVTAAVLDRSGRPPRYGDDDDGRCLVIDAPEANRWQSLLAAGAAVFGPLPWWPATAPDVRSLVLSALVGRVVEAGPRPSTRASHFGDAGLTILRSARGATEEIWCRCDGGPHGYLSIAAHAHADALSIELRHDGVEILVDPGTYCYHGEPTWRRYFRSTLAHNTLELDGQDQSVQAGPFQWLRKAATELLDVSVDYELGPQRWSAQHDGYERLQAPARHRRTVTLDPADRSLAIVDHLTSDSPHSVRLAFHLGPSVEAVVGGHQAVLRWEHPAGGQATAALQLPTQLSWCSHRGTTDPPIGWYSAGFGRKTPTTTLIGTGRAADAVFCTDLRFTSSP